MTRIIGDTKNASRRIGIIIERYGELVSRYRAEVLEMFTDTELQAIAEAAIESGYYDSGLDLAAHLATAVAEVPQVVGQHGVEAVKLSRKLGEMNYQYCVAVAEIVREPIYRMNASTQEAAEREPV